MRATFKYKLYPNRSQKTALVTLLDTHRHLYNRALAERRDAWADRQESISYVDQSARLKPDRLTNPFLAATNFSSCQMTLRRLNHAFEAFFRRVKGGEAEAGYPRFKGRHRFKTVEFATQGDGCRLTGNRVYVQHVGQIKVKLHRPTEGRIKTLSVTRQADGWFLVVSCDLGDAPPLVGGPSVGIDLGLSAFLVTSNGDRVAPPRVYRAAQASLRRAQRHLARCVKGSTRRAKARRRVARLHQRTANQRRDWHHKTALGLVRQAGIIAHEDLNIKGLARTRLAKSIYDAGWAQFLSVLGHKAEGAGVLVVGVNARNTSQICSACGALPATPLTLRDRVRCCPCGLVLDRDWNAARNIKRLGHSRQSTTSALALVG